jgi:hypothetical protein
MVHDNESVLRLYGARDREVHDRTRYGASRTPSLGVAIRRTAIPVLRSRKGEPVTWGRVDARAGIVPLRAGIPASGRSGDVVDGYGNAVTAYCRVRRRSRRSAGDMIAVSARTPFAPAGR